MTRAPFMKFGQTRNVYLRTATFGVMDETPKTRWDYTLWIERGEDGYALMSAQARRQIWRIVYREDWLAAPAVT